MAGDLQTREGSDLQQEKLLYYKALNDISNQIHSARDLDEILIHQKENILSLFDAEGLTIYVVDWKRRELYSRFKAGEISKEIRLPVGNHSLAGYTANTAQITNISNAYDPKELALVNKDIAFDRSWDERYHYLTRQVLTVPILYKRRVMGVLQLINKKTGDRFTLDDQNSAVEMARVLGIAFHNQSRLSLKRAKPSRFDYLLKNHIVTKNELDQAVVLARKKRVPVESIFMREMNVKKEDLGRSLAEYYRCEYVPFDARLSPPSEILGRLKPLYLRKNLWVPLWQKEGRVKVLVDNPGLLDKLDSIRALIPAKSYEFALGLPEDIIQFVDHFYGRFSENEPGSIDDLLQKLELPKIDPFEEKTPLLTEQDSVIVRLVNKIISEAYRRKASDIHIEPYPGSSGAEIRFRIDGLCRHYRAIPYHYKKAVISRIKIMADLDISERRKPQDGKIKFRRFSPLDIELRVVTVPTAGNDEDVVIRILPSGKPIPLEAMGMSQRDYDLFLSMIQRPYGIILVVGPTGSGKTTMLHSALDCINRPETKIWTAEDPVEITQRGLRQVQVRPKIGFDFAAAMRAFLRADPDVIMVGEMRDHETASIGVEASLTGHLVLSTLHTNSAPETIIRLLDMGMDPLNFADALIGILAQRLVRRLCEDCKEPYHPNRREYDLLAHNYGPNFERLGFSYTDDLILYRANGCSGCDNIGYKGRMSMIELLEATDEMKALIQGRAKVEELRGQAFRDGMTTLRQDGIRKVFLGLTDFQQVRKVSIK